MMTTSERARGIIKQQLATIRWYRKAAREKGKTIRHRGQTAF